MSLEGTNEAGACALRRETAKNHESSETSDRSTSPLTAAWHKPIKLWLPPLIVMLGSGCKSRGSTEQRNASPSSAAPTASLATATHPKVEPPASSSAARATVPPPRCPEGMLLIGGGEFWVGGTFNDEEQPNFLAVVHDFCLHETEVTLAAYQACVQAGACKPAGAERLTCNQSRSKSRGDHPVNCVDYRQASAYCAWQGARLPSEVEWEYAARGGERQYRYSWGNEDPDGRVCWKRAGTCKVKSFEPGAFGLYDMTGNVWEWTSDWFAPYPWPSLEGHARVYRGGSWSRRFVKWLRPELRNRYPEWQSGSHLGFRCAKTPSDVRCERSPENAERCLREVKDVKCARGTQFNGVRCARPGEPRCRDGFEERPGYGCVRKGGAPGPETLENSVDTQGVSRARSPQFDEDCLKHYPERPRAYRYTGGNHAGRNAVSRKVGCKNRDVGAGWNSTCCP